MQAILQTLRIIHLALPMGIIMVAIVFFINGSNGEPDQTLSTLAMIAGLLCYSAGLLIPTVLFKKLAEGRPGVLDSNSILSIIRKYQTYKIIQWAIIEGGAMLNLVIFYITGDMILFGAGLAGLALLIFSGPSITQIQKYAGITPEEWQSLSSQ